MGGDNHCGINLEVPNIVDILTGKKNNEEKRLDGTRSAPFTRLKLFARFERINKPDCDHLHWQILTAVCPLRNYATLLLSH